MNMLPYFYKKNRLIFDIKEHRATETFFIIGENRSTVKNEKGGRISEMGKCLLTCKRPEFNL